MDESKLLRNELRLDNYLYVRYVNLINNFVSRCLDGLRELDTTDVCSWAAHRQTIYGECYHMRNYFLGSDPQVTKDISTLTYQRVLQNLDAFIDEIEIFASNSVWVEVYCIYRYILGAILLPYFQDYDVKGCSNKLMNVVIDRLPLTPKLKKLKIQTRAYTDSIEFTLSALSELEEFTYPEFCNRNIISTLSCYCKKLRVLNIRESIDVTEDSIEFIIALKNLEHLVIKDCSISTASYVRILMNLPKLKNVSRDPVDAILEQLSENCAGRIVNIDSEINSIPLLYQKCSNITHLSLRLSTPMAIQDLSNLTNLRFFSVRVLHLEECNFYTYLERSGKSLKELELVCKKVDCSIIMALCCNLKTLSIRYAQLSWSTRFTRENFARHRLSLEVLKLHETQQGNDFFTHIYSYVNLEEFHALQVANVNDHFVHAIPPHAFKKLQVFLASFCLLNSVAAEMLIDKCDKLRYLGDFQDWPLVGEEQLETLKTKIRLENFEVKLILGDLEVLL